MEKSFNIQKEKEIKKEIAKLKKILKVLDKDTLAFIENLIKNAAFMAVSLAELRELIAEEGYTDSYQNGENQKGLKKSANVEVYNTMTKNYISAMTQLKDFLPNSKESEVKKAGDELAAFIMRGKPKKK